MSPPLLVLACLALVGVQLAIVSPTGNLPGDLLIVDLAEALDTEPFIGAAKILTDIGAFPIAALVALAVGWAVRMPALPAAFAVQWIAVQLLKEWEGRPRPAGRVVEASQHAFPSGHSANAVVFTAAALALLYAGRAQPRLVLVGVGLTLFVGATRLYLRVHYLSDVLGGFAVAAAAYLVAFALAPPRRSASMGAAP